MDKIKKHSSNLFPYLVQCLCPNIYGLELVKASMLLALVGGSSTQNRYMRSNIHVLIVGDPGLGKS